MWNTSSGAWTPIFCPASVRVPLQRLRRRKLVAMANAIQDRGALDIAKTCAGNRGTDLPLQHCPRLLEAQSVQRDSPGDILKSTRKVNYSA